MEEIASMNCDETLLQTEMQGILFQKLM